LKKPQLDLDRLAKINQASGVPIVMHGGSGLADNDFSQTIDRGVAKINYYTGMALKVMDSAKARLIQGDQQEFYHEHMMHVIHDIKEDAREIMRKFRSNGKA
jgi:fructose-bisphosphate aldolase class II